MFKTKQCCFPKFNPENRLSKTIFNQGFRILNVKKQYGKLTPFQPKHRPCSTVAKPTTMDTRSQFVDTNRIRISQL